MNTLELFKQSLPEFLQGLSITLEITVLALVFALLIGLAFGLLRISKNKFLRIIAVVYIDLIRGTPLIVQAFFIYFGLPYALNFKMPAFSAGVIAIAMNAGAYMAEIFRGGILAVDKGQIEAARSLGLSHGQAMRKVILPQAVKNMIPAFINQFIISLKDTSILSVIGIQELTQTGEIIVASNYRSFEIWIMVGLLYLIVITVLSYGARTLERSLKV